MRSAVMLLVLALAACTGGQPSGSPVPPASMPSPRAVGSPGLTSPAPGSSIPVRLRPCVDAVDRWRERAPASPADARELLGIFSRCQTVAELTVVVGATAGPRIANVAMWVDTQCRRFPLEHELGQTPLCRDARASR